MKIITLHRPVIWALLVSGFSVLTALGSGLPFFTESQEGCGIVSEYLTGNVSNDRYAELGERTLMKPLDMQMLDRIVTARAAA